MAVARKLHQGPEITGVFKLHVLHQFRVIIIIIITLLV
jgi:hypothetical protein